MDLFYWTPYSISYLVQLVMLVLIAGFFVSKSVIELRRKTKSAVTLPLTITFVSLALVILFQFLARTLHPDLVTFFLPWISPPAALAMAGYLQFAYAMPDDLKPPKSIERRVVLLISGIYVLFECANAINRASLHSQGYIEYRPGYMDLPLVLGFAWAVLIFLRQYANELSKARRQSDANISFIRSIIAPRQLSRNAQSARAFCIITLFPLAAVLLLTLRAFWLIDHVFTEIAFCWVMLFLTLGFAIAYLNAVPERSSFMVKLAGVSLTVVLIVLGSVSWIISPTLSLTYRSDAVQLEGNALRFEPTGTGAYNVNRTAMRFEEDIGKLQEFGNPLELPFPFPFYEKDERLVFTHPHGFLTFGEPMYTRDMTDRFGSRPSIIPLSVGLAIVYADTAFAKDGSQAKGIFVNSTPERVIITWYKMPTYTDETETFTFQMVMYPTGVIEFRYVDFPEFSNATVSDMGSGPGYTGITPGWLQGDIIRTSFIDSIPYTSPPNTAIMQDFRIKYTEQLNSIYAPIAGFALMVSVLVLLAVPAFLSANLVQPLKRLISGVETFRSGEFSSAIPITYRDEIGYLTGSFNELAEAQKNLIDTLETRVIERSETASALAADNARLEVRNHLSRELHDSVSQTLFSSTLIADTLPKLWQQDPKSAEAALETMRSLNRNALAEMRLLLLELRPGRIAERPLGVLLAELAKSFEAQHNLEIVVSMEADGVLPEEAQVTLYRIAQESLNNIVKHADATRVDIQFDVLPRQALLSVADNGKGFNLTDVPVGHMGLQIMRERMEKIGGSLEIKTAPGGGTTLTALWFADDDN